MLRVAAMGPFSWSVGSPLMKAEWRSVSMECGGQCVMVDGTAVMQQLCADNWVTLSAQVRVDLLDAYII